MLGFTPLASAPLADSGVQAQAYTITADSGTFSLTGQTVELANQLIITVDAGSFTVASQDNQFQLNNTNGFGSFSYSGQDAQFNFSMVAERGLFAFSGFPHVKVIRMDGRHVILSYSGQTANFATSFPVGHGTFSTTFQDADLLQSVLAETGTFTLTGQDAELSGVLSVDFAVGTFTASGQDASFTVTRQSDVGSFSTTGQASSFVTKFAVDVTSNPNGATSVQYDVSVASGTNEYGSGNKYYIDGLVGASPTLQLMAGVTYRFDQSASSNSGHPLRFSTTPNGTHGGGTEYTSAVTVNGVAGSSGAYIEITPTATTPRLYYYCTNHSGMGSQASINGGIHTASGQDANFVKDINLTADKADFVLSGQASVFGVTISTAHGSVVLSGQDASLNKALNVAANAGTFTLTGQDALKGISEIGAAVSYSVTGFDAHFAIRVAADSGTFTLTGQDALKGISELAAAVSYTLTGQDVTFAIQVTMIADGGTFALTGQDASVKFTYNRIEFDGYEQRTVFRGNSTIEVTTESINSVDIEAVDQNELELYSLTENSVTIAEHLNEAA